MSLRTARPSVGLATLKKPAQLMAGSNLQSTNNQSRLPHLGSKYKFGALTKEDRLSWLPDIQGGSAQEIKIHLPKLLKAQKHAQAGLQYLPNLSNRHYGALIVLDNGIEAVGTNMEGNRQLAICDLRNALNQALNQTLSQPRSSSSSSQGADTPMLPQVKTIYLVNANLDATPPIPCSDCQEWLNSRFCKPDTQVISLEQDANRNRPLIRVRTVKDMLPIHQARNNMALTTQQDVSQLPLSISKSAQRTLQQSDHPISNATLKKLMSQAQAQYQQSSQLTVDSGKPTGAAALLSPFSTMASAGRIDWSTRWNEPADLRAIGKGLESLVHWQKAIQPLFSSASVPNFIKNYLKHWAEPPKVQAVAYYGDDPQLPPIPSLGRIARQRGSLDTLILTVEREQLQVRTIGDYMPEMYQTRPNT